MGRNPAYIILGILLILIGINSIYPLPYSLTGAIWGVVVIIIGVLLISGLFTGRRINPVGLGVGIVMIVMGINCFYPLPTLLMTKLWALFFIVTGLGFLLHKKL